MTQPFNCFADWCRHQDDLSPEARHTVEVLLKLAGTFNCNKADRVLSRCTELILSSSQISDITPLSGLTNLFKLYLGDNQISDITPLFGLTNLTSLILDGNQISDITPLSGLTNLTSLILDGNRISDITPLSGLTNLHTLYLCDSRISDITPLSGLTNLNELALNNNPISTNLKLPKKLQQQWRNLLTEPIACQQAIVAVESAYASIGFTEPDIIFASSPQAALASLGGWEPLGEPLAKMLFKAVKKTPSLGLWAWLSRQMAFQLLWEVQGQLEQQLEDEIIAQGINYIAPEALVKLIGIPDFCISELGYVFEQKQQEVLRCLKLIFESCGWIFPYEKVCVVCDRPRILSFDNQERLHAEGAPAVQFADGWSIYAYHGVRFPEKYGKVHPNQWQAQWLLEEKNAELRRTLIQGIGYDRICQELQAIELDTWQEYTLIKIDADADEEPIYLLKMSCPSTGYIHAIRVPPDMNSACEAIAWVNWGITPEEFSVQT